jgi:hypothetical protein
MSVDLRSLGPRGLATQLERRLAAKDKVGDKIRALAASGEERWSDTVLRLGVDHPLIQRFNVAADATEEVYSECQRRYSAKAVTYRSMWPTFLRVRAVQIG